jgi:hypothetical protein
VVYSFLVLGSLGLPIEWPYNVGKKKPETNNQKTVDELGGLGVWYGTFKIELIAFE